MFADDTKFFAVVNCFDQQNNLQRCVDKLVRWTEFNQLDINASKTKKVSYLPKSAFASSQYYINATPIENVKEMKDLGILFESKITFKPHIDEVIMKSIV